MASPEIIPDESLDMVDMSDSALFSAASPLRSWYCEFPATQGCSNACANMATTYNCMVDACESGYGGGGGSYDLCSQINSQLSAHHCGCAMECGQFLDSCDAAADAVNFGVLGLIALAAVFNTCAWWYFGKSVAAACCSSDKKSSREPLLG